MFIYQTKEIPNIVFQTFQVGKVNTIKNKNLVPSNRSGDFFVDNAVIDNIYADKVQLVIKFMDYDEFKIFDKQ